MVGRPFPAGLTPDPLLFSSTTCTFPSQDLPVPGVNAPEVNGSKRLRISLAALLLCQSLPDSGKPWQELWKNTQRLGKAPSSTRSTWYLPFEPLRFFQNCNLNIQNSKNKPRNCELRKQLELIYTRVSQHIVLGNCCGGGPVHCSVV